MGACYVCSKVLFAWENFVAVRAWAVRLGCYALAFVVAATSADVEVFSTECEVKRAKDLRLTYSEPRKLYVVVSRKGQLRDRAGVD